MAVIGLSRFLFESIADYLKTIEDTILGILEQKSISPVPFLSDIFYIAMKKFWICVISYITCT